MNTTNWDLFAHPNSSHFAKGVKAGGISSSAGRAIARSDYEGSNW